MFVACSVHATEGGTKHSLGRWICVCSERELSRRIRVCVFALRVITTTLQWMPFLVYAIAKTQGYIKATSKYETMVEERTK